MTEAVSLALIALFSTLFVLITIAIVTHQVLKHNPSSFKVSMGGNCIEADFDNKADK